MPRGVEIPSEAWLLPTLWQAMTSLPTAPLAAASRRLRGKPGRPRKTNSGRVHATPQVDGGGDDARQGGGSAQAPITPRLLDLMTTAAYLGVSPWTVRDLEAAGVLPRVCVPLPGGRDLRKLLFDRADLDRLIEAWKERPDTIAPGT